MISRTGVFLPSDLPIAQKPSLMTTPRFYWSETRNGHSSNEQHRLDLIEAVTSRPVATIIRVSRYWYWKRKTSLLLDGAPSAEGVSVNLVEAKSKVLEGLPGEK
jgi:hypothetical protein